MSERVLTPKRPPKKLGTWTASPSTLRVAMLAYPGVQILDVIGSVRVETARRLLEESGDDLETICARDGLGTPESMRRAFLRAVGIPPSRYRERFSRNHASEGRPRSAPPATRRPA